MKTEIYLAHALTGAPETFKRRMFAVRSAINALSNTIVLEFNWIPGIGPDLTKNTYQCDMGQVYKAKLMIAILDHPSVGLGMEIQARCRNYAPLRCFVPKGMRLSQIIPDCIRHYRQIGPREIDLPEPIIYERDDEIVGSIVDWVAKIQVNENPAY